MRSKLDVKAALGDSALLCTVALSCAEIECKGQGIKRTVLGLYMHAPRDRRTVAHQASVMLHVERRHPGPSVAGLIASARST